MHFQQILRETKSKNGKFRIRWSKVPRDLGPLKSSYAHFSHPANHGGGEFSSQKTPKMAINRNFPGLRHFQQILRVTKLKSTKFRIRWSKVPRDLGPLKWSYGHFSHPAGHGRGIFSSRKTLKMAISRDYPGLRAFSAIFAKVKSKSAKFRIRWSKVPRVLGPLRLIYGHFSHPAGHGRGKFSSRITPRMAIYRDFPGLRAFPANFARDQIEEREIPHPMVKSAARLGAPKIELCPF